MPNLLSDPFVCTSFDVCIFIQLFACVPVLVVFVLTSRPAISCWPPNPLRAFLVASHPPLPPNRHHWSNDDGLEDSPVRAPGP